MRMRGLAIKVAEPSGDWGKSMKKWGRAIGLIVVFCFPHPVWADNANAILSKEDSAQMFAMSEVQWIANVVAIKTNRLGDYSIVPTGEYTLYMRPDSSSGLLAVTPSYSSSNKSYPWKLSVSIIADTPAASLLYGAMAEDEVEDLLSTAMNEMTPEFSVMGYMVRNNSMPPSIHFTIFRKNDFPPIDTLNELGRVCPTQEGEKTCVRTSMIGTN